MMNDSFAGKRVALYGRVSTKRQEANDLSIPDQIDHGDRWIEEHGAVKAMTYIEGGASATKDDRAKFRAMIDHATNGERPFDIVLVHSLSRLFRNALHYMQYKAKLASHGVRIISITQQFGDDPASDLALGMLALFDEYHSAENGKHVRRTMVANAVRGYWNGQTPPIGYHSVAVPQPKGKDRKRLEHDPETLHIPRFIFDAYVNGTASGDLGITRLADLLNKRGERLRGCRFHVSNVHRILTNTAYIGYVTYNQRDSRTGLTRPEEEWVAIPVPPLVSEELFLAARAKMTRNDPGMGGSSEKSNLNLLTTIVKCGCDGDGCGGSMTTSTGKSGRYKYYACSHRATSGTAACDGRRVPMAKLDTIVIDSLIEHVLQPDRLKALLQSWLDNSRSATESRAAALKEARRRLTMLDGESANVIKLVRSGICPPDDPQVASELANITAQKKAVNADIALLEGQLAGSDRAISPAVLEGFSDLMRRKLSNPANKVERKAYVRLLVNRVDVGRRNIRISGSPHALARAAASSGKAVPKVEREWCTRRDSNPWPPD
jgi:site-specific DNA recombinase